MTQLPDGHRLQAHDLLDSTNEEARRLALAGESGPVWITAQRQTAGRGRLGRVWDSAAGNLAATLLTRPARPLPDWPQLSFAAALAVAETVSRFAPAAAVQVKWPNDVLAGGRKIAGILLETAGLAATPALAIGIGINLAGHPDQTEFPAIALTALGVTPPAPQEALAVLAEAFAAWQARWEREGFSPIRAAWLARAAGLGGPVRARLPGRERHGLFEGIDATGALLLNEGASVAAIAAGEVFFG